MTRGDDVNDTARHGILITDHEFVGERGRFHIHELTDLTDEPASMPPAQRAGLVVGAVGLVMSCSWVWSMPSVAFFLAAVVATGVAFGVAAFFAWRRPREHRMMATYRGRRVVLFRTVDVAEFGMVARALRRAIEQDHESGGPTVPDPSPPQRVPSARPAAPPPEPPPPPTPRAGRPVTARALDDVFAHYDELLLRFGPPPGWQPAEGNHR